MKGLGLEYFIETVVTVKRGVKLKSVKVAMPHPMSGDRMEYAVRACPHDYGHPADFPFSSPMQVTLCPHGCFKITRKERK